MNKFIPDKILRDKENHQIFRPLNEESLIELEIVKTGYANGVAEGYPLSSEEKDEMINKASHAFGLFLDALKCDWKNDPNSLDTPNRVAKAYVNDLAGRYDDMSLITFFPSDGYDGMIIERNIPLTSICSHHHQTISGVTHIGYIAGDSGKVVGLSKLNRIVELFSRRGSIQEQLTSAIHNAVNAITKGNKGIIVTIIAGHKCVSCRGVKHKGAEMVTTKASGDFLKITICLEKNFLIALRLTIKKLKNSKLLARCTPKRNPLLSGFLFIQ